MKLGFNTSGNSQTSGRTTQAILGLGCLRNTKGSLTRKFKYCNERDRNYVFQCVFNQPISPKCPSITLADIATTNDGIVWLLNGNKTILACQTLEIPVSQELQTNHFTLTNNGSINVRGKLRNAIDNMDLPGNSITINNGIINVFYGGEIVISTNNVGQDAIFTNNGLVNNAGNIYCQFQGIINNNTGGTITNNASINNSTSATINNNFGAIIDGTGAIFNDDSTSIIMNTGTITITGSTGGVQNSGTIYVNGGTINLDLTANAGILNNGTLYVYNSGTITGFATAQIVNNTTISVADGSSTCGTGYITFVAVINQPITNNNCPP